MSESEYLDDDIPEAPVVALTRSQLTAYESLRDHGTLHYGGAAAGFQQLKPRLYPLIAGPTGSGKSFLVEQVARELQADYFRITYGDFIPMGAKDVNAATLVRLARKLARSSRVVVHIDELDKWLAGDREWSRSITTDLWNLLDGKLPWEQVLLLETDSPQKPAPAEGAPPSGDESADDCPEYPDNMFRTDHMWIVGSGTWQAIFEHRNARSIGFQTKEASSVGSNDRELAEAIRNSKVIPTELTARFATDILVLGYPSRKETEQLLVFYGLKQFAAELGMSVSADDVDYAAAGMRALESLKTRFLLESLRRQRRIDLIKAKTGPVPE
jgi:SpoVK/Ycf46/Vps4 family AAA+-type ATPase